MLSFVVPAHNEESCLGRTLEAIHDAGRVVGQPYEIMVVDDASTDATAEIARQHNVTVVPVNHRKIAATRNSGARAARGERLFFVDADTVVNPPAVASALRCMDRGAVGGGAAVWFDGALPLYVRVWTVFIGVLCKVSDVTGGAFLFCTREAFDATGGFNESFFWAEEAMFIEALKRRGRFVVIWERVLTSGRRARTMSGLEVLALCSRAVLFPIKTFTRRSSVEKIWYNSNRAGDDRMPDSAAARISNGLTLVLTIIVVTGFGWNFIPWSWTPLAGVPGKIRFAIAALLCHVGLIFFWPLALWLGATLGMCLFQKRWWTNWIKLTALLAFCLWQAWFSTLGVIWIWTTLYEWIIPAHGTL